jgi:hypothetical protein
MSKYCEIIQYHDREILYVNCSGRSSDEMLEAMSEMLGNIEAKPKGELVLVLMNMENTTTSIAVNNKGRQIVQRAKEEGYPEMPTAIYGFTGAQRLVTKMFAQMRRSNTLFVADTLEEARNWLVNWKNQ